MTTTTFTHHADLASQVEVPDDGILTRTLHEDDALKVVLFGFSTGQTLSEHTAAVPAVLHVLDGTLDLVLDGEERTAMPGTWVHMPARLPHSLSARGPSKVLLMLLKSGADD